MKSALRQKMEADLISSEAKAEDFIRACEDFIVQSTISLTFYRFCDTMNKRGDKNDKKAILDSDPNHIASLSCTIYSGYRFFINQD